MGCLILLHHSFFQVKTTDAKPVVESQVKTAATLKSPPQTTESKRSPLQTTRRRCTLSESKTNENSLATKRKRRLSQPVESMKRSLRVKCPVSELTPNPCSNVTSEEKPRLRITRLSSSPLPEQQNIYMITPVEVINTIAKSKSPTRTLLNASSPLIKEVSEPAISSVKKKTRPSNLPVPLPKEVQSQPVVSNTESTKSPFTQVSEHSKVSPRITTPQASRMKCPVCDTVTGCGTFLCMGCAWWVHPKCGGYTKLEVQSAGKTDAKNDLKCNNCKQVDFSLRARKVSVTQP